MNFSDFFIRRPIFAGVLSAVIFLVGLLAVWKLPVSEYPEVVPPTVVVQAKYPARIPRRLPRRWLRPSNNRSTASRIRSTCSRRPRPTG